MQNFITLKNKTPFDSEDDIESIDKNVDEISVFGNILKLSIVALLDNFLDNIFSEDFTILISQVDNTIGISLIHVEITSTIIEIREIFGNFSSAMVICRRGPRCGN